MRLFVACVLVGRCATCCVAEVVNGRDGARTKEFGRGYGQAVQFMFVASATNDRVTARFEHDNLGGLLYTYMRIR